MSDIKEKKPREPYIIYRKNGEEKIFVFDTQYQKSGFEDPFAVCRNFCNIFEVREVVLYIPGKEPFVYRHN